MESNFSKIIGNSSACKKSRIRIQKNPEQEWVPYFQKDQRGCFPQWCRFRKNEQLFVSLSSCNLIFISYESSKWIFFIFYFVKKKKVVNKHWYKFKSSDFLDIDLEAGNVGFKDCGVVVLEVLELILAHGYFLFQEIYLLLSPLDSGINQVDLVPGWCEI